MKLSTRDKNLIVFVICAAIIALAWFFGYQKLDEKNQELDKEIAKNEAQKKDLEDQLRKKDYYEENIITKTVKYNRLLSEYPEGITQENQYQFLLQVMETLDIKDENSSFSMTKPTKVFDFPQIYQYKEDYSGISSEMMLNFTTTYAKYKAFLQYIETCDNTATQFLLADGTMYEQEWPVHKSFVTAASASRVGASEDESEAETRVACSVKIKQLAITSENRIYLDPTIVNIPGYNPALSKKDIFKENDESDEPLTEAELITRAKTAYDAKITVTAGEAAMQMEDGAGSLSAKGTKDKDLYITIEESESAGLYFVTYSFGTNAYEAENKSGLSYKFMPMMPQDTIDLLVVSKARFETEAYKLRSDGSNGEKVMINDNNAQDKLNIHLNNKTGKTVNLVILGEPADAIEEYSDGFRVTPVDGLQYVPVDRENITGDVNIISVIDEEVSALSLLGAE